MRKRPLMRAAARVGILLTAAAAGESTMMMEAPSHSDPAAVKMSQPLTTTTPTKIVEYNRRLDQFYQWDSDDDGDAEGYSSIGTDTSGGDTLPQQEVSSSRGGSGGSSNFHRDKGSSSSYNSGVDHVSPASSSSLDGYSTYGYGDSSSLTYGTHKNPARDHHHHDPVKEVPIMTIFMLFLLLWAVSMVFTAHQFYVHPQGAFANGCRTLLQTGQCISKVLYNLYHCRLGEVFVLVIQNIGEEEEDDDDDEYTDEELARMQPRPGIARALELEHGKALRKMEIELKQANNNNNNKPLPRESDGLTKEAGDEKRKPKKKKKKHKPKIRRSEGDVQFVG